MGQERTQNSPKNSETTQSVFSNRALPPIPKGVRNDRLFDPSKYAMSISWMIVSFDSILQAYLNQSIM